MIEVKDLVKRHRGAEILRGVSLRVHPGEVAAIIGPSGGGKTTLLRCLNGLESWDEGSVTVNGLAVAAATPPRARATTFATIRRSVGMVLQDFQLWPHRTVLQNVTEAPRQVLRLDRAAARTRALGLLDRVGLLAKADAYPGHLSGGQRQRVAIARALAMEPRAILFDEPTSALDPSMTGEVIAILRDLAGDGLTLVIVTHTIALARQLARTVHVIADGQVIESGPARTVLGQPAHPTTRHLVSTITTDEPEPPRIPVTSDLENSPPSGRLNTAGDVAQLGER